MINILAVEFTNTERDKMKSMLSTAIRIAVEAHEGQYDKGDNAYILHPLKVMHYLKSEDEE